jgi:ribosome-associated heat shock protein Hsp15
MTIKSVSEASVRLDVWLWAARFYKTRALAKTAIDAGRVRVNGQPCKPAKALHIDDLIRCTQGLEQLEVRVMALNNQRASASIAATLYAELAESMKIRLSLREQSLLARLGYQAPATKPDKRARRRIKRFESVESFDLSGFACLTNLTSSKSNLQ